MSALVVHCEERVGRTPEEVWSYVADDYFDHHPRWDPAILEMTALTPGPVGVGTRGIETRRFVTRQRAEFEVTAFEPPRRFAFSNRSGPFSVERAYTFAPDGDGTLLVFDFTMSPKGVMRLPFRWLRSTIERQVRANIARIPALLSRPTA